MLISIPFPGFYETTLSELPDQNLKYILDDAPVETAREIWDLISDTKDYVSAYQDLAMRYLKNFAIAFNEASGFNITFEFDSLESPREYNFETDRLFAQISYADAKKLYRRCDKDRLRKKVKERFTSRSGFISGYSANLGTWCAKPVLHWDHNELGTVLECLCEDLEGLRYETLEQEIESLTQDDYGNGNGVDIDDKKYTSDYAKKHSPDKVARLEKLLDLQFEKARA